MDPKRNTPNQIIQNTTRWLKIFRLSSFLYIMINLIYFITMTISVNITIFKTNKNFVNKIVISNMIINIIFHLGILFFNYKVWKLGKKFIGILHSHFEFKLTLVRFINNFIFLYNTISSILTIL